MTKKALILGASGLVGNTLTNLLCNDIAYDEIHILVRRSLNFAHDKLIEHVINFEHLSSYSSLFEVNDVFCCLGTTMKRAKTKEAFYQVDHDYVLEAAKLASIHHAKFLVVSSMGADPHSMFYYSRVKGEMERSLQSLNLPVLYIFRPSLLLGYRAEFRFGETLVTPVSKWLLRGPLVRYKPNHAKTVANAMCTAAKLSNTGTHIYTSIDIEKIGQGVY
ncbi:NAD-dependent epimerase/dehydratase family protein [Shimazuella kribbensis]|uniref:NAD-dependent epimerase/dehydratase family protein n=1 Tax=Shimazuella kribbensis TaxID=139808 RepID=UPI000416136A|nr:NAD-dependent epimerase/dehydratase family protein [Shimazuella kribbensis]